MRGSQTTAAKKLWRPERVSSRSRPLRLERLQGAIDQLVLLLGDFIIFRDRGEVSLDQVLPLQRCLEPKVADDARIRTVGTPKLRQCFNFVIAKSMCDQRDLAIEDGAQNPHGTGIGPACPLRRIEIEEPARLVPDNFQTLLFA